MGKKEIAEVNELSAVVPNEFFIELGGKKRQIKFGNLTLARIEEKYGTVMDFDALQKDMTEKPMKTIPWLLSITLKDKEGLDLSVDGLLEEMDNSNLTVKDVIDVVTKAMNSSLSNMFGSKK